MKLAWEIEVLSRSVQYPNLSIAASQIGLSQPQLSRILRRVEEVLQVKLLERDSKRKVSWKGEAYKLAEIYWQHNRSWEGELDSLSQKDKVLKKVKIGCLEGLSELATELIAKIIQFEKGLDEVEVEALDLGDLEKAFLENSFDLILSSRIPGKKKFQNLASMGYQKFSKFEGSSGWEVKTPFELLKSQKKKNQKNIVTKSLWLKSLCRDRLDATALIPQKINKGQGGRPQRDSYDYFPVYLIAQDEFPGAVWKELLRS